MLDGGRLAALGGDLAQLPSAATARLEPSLHLRYQVEERGPYTTLLCMTLTAPTPTPLPVLYVRIYHDARVAEASDVRAGLQARLPLLPVQGETLAPRWARNVMLNKWLEYCADQGCRFAPAAP